MAVPLYPPPAGCISSVGLPSELKLRRTALPFPLGRSLIRTVPRLSRSFQRFKTCPGDNRFLLGYRPLRLVDAVWQRFAEEISGRIQCVRCPASKCGRWLLKGAARSDSRLLLQRMQEPGVPRTTPPSGSERRLHCSAASPLLPICSAAHSRKSTLHGQCCDGRVPIRN